MRSNRITRLWLAVGAALTVLAIATPAALAGVTSFAGASTDIDAVCGDAKLVQPFAKLGDTGYYALAPNGNLESGSTGWQLSGGASVVSGNEPYYVGSKKDKRVLAIPAGAVATTPAICIGIEYPWSRLFVKGSAGGTLAVDILWVDPFGQTQATPLSSIGGTGAWALSGKLYYASFLSPFSGLTTGDDDLAERQTAVAFRFTAKAGSWSVDDLYVDPFKLH